MASYDDGTGEPISEQPGLRPDSHRAWHKPQRRQTVIKMHELRPWYEAVESFEIPMTL